MTSRFLTPQGHRLTETEGRILRAVRELSIPSPHYRGTPAPTLYQVARRCGLDTGTGWSDTLTLFSRLIQRGLLQLTENGGLAV